VTEVCNRRRLGQRKNRKGAIPPALLRRACRERRPVGLLAVRRHRALKEGSRCRSCPRPGRSAEDGTGGDAGLRLRFHHEMRAGLGEGDDANRRGRGIGRISGEQGLPSGPVVISNGREPVEETVYSVMVWSSG